MHTLRCLICKTDFQAVRHDATTCGNICRSRLRRDRDRDRERRLAFLLLDIAALVPAEHAAKAEQARQLAREVP